MYTTIAGDNLESYIRRQIIHRDQNGSIIHFTLFLTNCVTSSIDCSNSQLAQYVNR